MKRVDGKLLEKYYTGRCTPEERKRVEAWLESGEAHETPDLPENVKMSHKAQMWHNIMGEIDIAQPAAKTIPIYKKVIRYAAAACVAITLIGTGYFYGINNDITVISAFTAEVPGQLHISTGADKTAKIDGDQFRIQFEGFLQLYNASNSKMSITAGGKSYVLKPSKVYYLTGSHKKSLFIEDAKLPLDLRYRFDRIKNGNYSIHNS